jgi:hypothetical protein
MREEEIALQALAGINVEEIVEELKDKLYLREVFDYFEDLRLHEFYISNLEELWASNKWNYQRYSFIDDPLVFGRDISQFPRRYRILAEIILKDFKRRGDRLLEKAEELIELGKV